MMDIKHSSKLVTIASRRTSPAKMKIVILACLLAVALAAPRPDQNAEILRDDKHYGPGNAEFSYNYETSNQIKEARAGAAGEQGQSNFDGEYSYRTEDGLIVTVTYVANALGFQPVSTITRARR